MAETKKLMVINVLPAEVYDDCHIKGSINVPLNTLEEHVKTIEKGTPIVVYCASYICSASLAAWRMLNAMEFTNIWAYEAGMSEWYHAGLPREGACDKPYLAEPVPRPEGHDSGVKEITTKELKAMMEEQGML